MTPVSPTDIIHAISDLAGPVPGTLSDAWQALIGDRVATWRLANAAKLQERVRRHLEDRNLSLNPARIPERYAFAWFEEATKQDEPEIQDLFAKLLARAADGDKDAADRRHVEALGRFTPEDARAFQFVMNAVVIRLSSGLPYIPSEFGFDTDDLMDRLVAAQGDSAWLAIEHLASIGVLARRHTVNAPSLDKVLERVGERADSVNDGIADSTPPPLQLDSQIWATRLGVSLGRALGLLPV